MSLGVLSQIFYFAYSFKTLAVHAKVKLTKGRT